MKITESTVRQIEITEVSGLDPIRVMLSDLAPRQGRITIECWGKSWSSYWGGMGERTIAQFFCSCNDNYLAGYLAPDLPGNIFDPEHLSDSLKRAIIKERKRRLLTHEEARERFNEIEETDFPETIDGLWSMSSEMTNLLGDEWWYRLPKKPNPDYQYLCRIIKTVQEALQEFNTRAKDGHHEIGRPEMLRWLSCADDYLPDSDTTVLIRTLDCDDPVWIGYWDGDKWMTVEGFRAGRVTHWAEFPTGPEVAHAA